MGPFAAYANNYLTADTCCCDGDLFDQYPYEETFEDQATTCEDYKHSNGMPWHDKNGWTCRVYHYGDLCTSNGGKGSGWDNAWGSIQDNEMEFDDFDKEYTNAKDACCSCGGGWKQPHWDLLPTSELKKIDAALLKKDHDAKTMEKAQKLFLRIFEDDEKYNY